MRSPFRRFIVVASAVLSAVACRAQSAIESGAIVVPGFGIALPGTEAITGAGMGGGGAIRLPSPDSMDTSGEGSSSDGGGGEARKTAASWNNSNPQQQQEQQQQDADCRKARDAACQQVSNLSAYSCTGYGGYSQYNGGLYGKGGYYGSGGIYGSSGGFSSYCTAIINRCSEPCHGDPPPANTGAMICGAGQGVAVVRELPSAQNSYQGVNRYACLPCASGVPVVKDSNGSTTCGGQIGFGGTLQVSGSGTYLTGWGGQYGSISTSQGVYYASGAPPAPTTPSQTPAPQPSQPPLMTTPIGGSSGSATLSGR